MEISSLLLLIFDLSLNEPTCKPKLVENMVMVDHDLSGGVISSLYPENSDTIRGINPSTTKVFPQEALHKMIPKEEP